MKAFSLPSLNQLNNIATIIIAVLSVIAMALGLMNQGGSGSSDSPPSSSGTINEGYPQTGAYELDLTRSSEQAKLKTELSEIYNRSRIDKSLPALVFDSDLENNAHAQAQYSARTNEFQKNNNNVYMVQLKIPYPISSAVRVLQEMYRDPGTNAVLSRTDVSRMGIGIASSQGNDWVVIQLR